MNRLQENWIKASKDLNLEITPDFILELRESGGVVVIKTDLFIKSFGMSKGMLVVTNYDVISPYVCELIQMGYGFVILDEDDNFNDQKMCIKYLKDWGWSGDKNLCPAWCK